MPDIIKTKRSLKEILPKNTPMDNFRHTMPPNDTPPPRPRNIDWAPRRRFSPRLLMAVVAIVIVAFGALIAGSVMSKVTIKVTPKQGRVLLNNTFDAYKSPTEGDLAFSLISSLSDTEKKLVPASGSETVSKKASGEITIFNNYEAKPQKLVKNTRFESPDGKIFRISEAVTVPAMTIKDGVNTPGQVKAAVFADQAGTTYNIGPAEFTIPGFKGAPQFEKMYARSTSPMSGGFEGQVKKVATADKTKALNELETVLAERMVKAAKLQIPAGYILFNDAYFITFEEVLPPQNATSSDMAEITLKGTFHGIIFDRLALSEKVIRDANPDFELPSVEIKNINELKFNLKDREAIKGPEIEKISFTIEGNGHWVATFNQDELISRLRSAPKDNIQSAASQFPSIDSLEIIFFPPWSKNIPDNTAKIKVEINDND